MKNKIETSTIIVVTLGIIFLMFYGIRIDDAKYYKEKHKNDSILHRVNVKDSLDTIPIFAKYFIVEDKAGNILAIFSDTSTTVIGAYCKTKLTHGQYDSIIKAISGTHRLFEGCKLRPVRKKRINKFKRSWFIRQDSIDTNSYIQFEPIMKYEKRLHIIDSIIKERMKQDTDKGVEIEDSLLEK